MTQRCDVNENRRALLGMGLVGSGLAVWPGLGATEQSAPAAAIISAAIPAVTRVAMASSFRPIAWQLNYDGYLISGFGTNRIASATLNFEPTGAGYRIILSVKSMLADLTYQSEGLIDQYGLQPQIYNEQRHVVFKSRRAKKVRYVVTQESNQVNRRDGDQLFVPPGTQDRLSLMLQVSLMARASPQVLEPKKQLSIPFARMDAVSPSNWSAAKPAKVRLNAESRESTSAGAGRLAQRIARVADSKETMEVAFWLTADADRLPLVLQFTENGRSLKFVARL